MESEINGEWRDPALRLRWRPKDLDKDPTGTSESLRSDCNLLIAAERIGMGIALSLEGSVSVAVAESGAELLESGLLFKSLRLGDAGGTNIGVLGELSDGLTDISRDNFICGGSFTTVVIDITEGGNEDGDVLVETSERKTSGCGVC